jgi:GTPase
MKQNLVDIASFVVVAGKGGNGAVHFRREKYVPKGGPDGGNGGRGGSVWLRTEERRATLKDFAGKDQFEAEPGKPGGKRQQTGEDGQDLVLTVPVGTVVYVNTSDYGLLTGRNFHGKKADEIKESGMKLDTVPYRDFGERWEIESQKSKVKSQNDKQIPNTKNQTHTSVLRDEYDVAHAGDTLEDSREKTEWVEVADLDQDGMELVLAYGGRGGHGNTTYKSSTMTTPWFAQTGERGEWFEVRLELKVLADVGLVGMPNAGKSTLLSVLTAAKPEIADYPFTTLAPNLGVLEYNENRLVVADIPGLIEEAHTGKGLGDTFLRHVERCSVLCYVVAPYLEGEMDLDERVGEQLVAQYETIREEVGAYGHHLADKPAVVVVNKLDLLSPDQRDAVSRAFDEMGMEPAMVSAATTEGIETLKRVLFELAGVGGEL